MRSGSVPLLRKETRWYCPNCTTEAVTVEARPHSQFHSCKGMKGIVAPLVEVGTKAKVEAREREDYLGRDNGKVRLDGEGRPIMSVVTTRDGGQDTAVFAPVATASKE